MSDPSIVTVPFFKRIVRLFAGMLSRTRTLSLLVTYALVLVLSFYLSYALRFDFDVPDKHAAERDSMVWWIVGFKLSLLYAFGQFNTLMTYFRIPDLLRIIAAMTAAMLFMAVMWYLFEGEDLPPRGTILTDYVLGVFMICMLRLGLRLMRERVLAERPVRRLGQELALIVGTGDAGEALASDLLSKPGIGIRPVGFLDWKGERVGKEIHGIPVLGSPNQLSLVTARYRINRIILALPPAQRKNAREVIERAHDLGITVEVVPSMHELASGQIRATQLRRVQFEDLLGREAVSLDSDSIRRLIRGKCVCITGAGGSIGSELARQVASYAPSCLLMIDQSESALFEIEQELLRKHGGLALVSVVADIVQKERVEALLREHRPQLLFHAAAYKHVPMMEHQPAEALRNNSMATAQLGELASACGVEQFVYISTDKAINPTSVMGATKRLGEIYLQALQRKPGNTCAFVAVRFGNVLGSSGSVIPIFKRQIAEGGPITVTHPEVKRYFMTIPEAVGLVLQSAVVGMAGDILVLDMGEPIRIVDVARQLIRLSGLEPDRDIAIRFSGLRPGEKLFEELQHRGESLSSTEHASIMRLRCGEIDYEAGCRMVEKIRQALTQNSEVSALRRLIREEVPEYTPYEEAVEKDSKEASASSASGTRV